jgi:hypothetical protein
MIYFVFSGTVRIYSNFPEIGFISKHTKFADLPFKEKAVAEKIFTFEGGKTVYMKNRHDALPNGYQYSEEERLVIVLKAVPL